jgi:hypothetical protein
MPWIKPAAWVGFKRKGHCNETRPSFRARKQFKSLFMHELLCLFAISITGKEYMFETRSLRHLFARLVKCEKAAPYAVHY